MQYMQYRSRKLARLYDIVKISSIFINDVSFIFASTKCKLIKNRTSENEFNFVKTYLKHTDTQHINMC